MVELIIGLIGFVITAAAGILSPLISCLCCSPLGSVGAGFGACAFRRPPSDQAVQRGLIGGLAFAGGGILGTGVGILFSSLLGATLGTSRELARQLGLPEPQSGMDYLLGGLISFCAAALIIPLISAGGGALGGVLWRAFRGSSTETPVPGETSRPMDRV
ncbi:MAG: hypothetical protein RMM10_05685 [Anaerolineae bacterium]|uniref:hypothetical protein n=1 Tax=Thermoflexus sp. TaxID=1969742 RepID=UPI0025CC3646|nr:hypothetical protein [Thermoflexus sp.]MCS7351002.1 hypothetical protein [Thermoflexus sp.]MDW8180454.1 hypothetical protein [Anaerolineae bacterium]